MSLYLTLCVCCVSGGDVGHVQPVSGGDGSTGLLQVEGGHLCFYWTTLELPAGHEVALSFILAVYLSGEAALLVFISPGPDESLTW